ncbi:MAG: hypothetical protein KME31_27345 [Tolypothrix carrinoi HA7290-LM1]|jgi:hypothetical protein|nr:hypothetical protein [Tolypothrix carrinoi HA7290-LM1]
MPTKAKRGETVDLFITLTDSASDTGKGGGKENTKVKFAWKGTKEAYPDEIAKELGVSIAKDNEPGLIFGMNRPRPARVYINVKTGSGGTAGKGGKSKSNHRAYFLFANPAKLGTLLIKNSLRGKKYRGGTISSVSLPKTSTNPSRPKKSSKTKPRTKTR